MQSLFDLINNKPVKKGPTSQRAEVLEQLCVMMDGNTSRFGYWSGRTRKLTPSGIYQMMRQAKEGSNPQALFNWLLKQHNALEKGHKK